MKTASTIFPFIHNFGAGAGNLTCAVDANSLCEWHEENSCWYVKPGQVPVYAQHDANYRGIKVERENLVVHGEPWTHKEYMDCDKITAGVYDGSKGHDAWFAYYNQYVNKYVTGCVLDYIGADKLLASRDIHLNDIPLKLWDNLPGLRHFETVAKACDDWMSLSLKGSAYKVAAERWLRANGGLPAWRVRYQYPGMPGDVNHDLYSYAIGSDPESALVAFRAVNPGTVRHEIIDCEGKPL